MILSCEPAEMQSFLLASGNAKKPISIAVFLAICLLTLRVGRQGEQMNAYS
jgi:hypothetical protein